MTAELKVAYHRPTPLFTDLEFEAQVERVEDRKVTTRGWLACNGKRTASAVGLFIRPVFDSERTSWLLGDEQVARIRAHRAEGSVADGADREAED
ncbi:MAG: hypothetical protein JRE71_05515 [Deltaproteobacteria bacterium]|nr:hypothetical protein [Deltaproteobacteria bacterium]